MKNVIIEKTNIVKKYKGEKFEKTYIFSESDGEYQVVYIEVKNDENCLRRIIRRCA